YRHTVRVAACMTRSLYPVRYVEGPIGLPHLAATQPSEGAAQLAACRGEADTAEGPATPKSSQNPLICVKQQVDVEGCLRRAVGDGIADVAPVPLLLYTGAVSERSAVPAQTVAGVALAVAVLAVLGTLLLSRRVLR